LKGHESQRNFVSGHAGSALTEFLIQGQKSTSIKGRRFTRYPSSFHIQVGATMLVLSRKSNEQILVGDFIKITVLGIQGNQVRLGFRSPQRCRDLACGTRSLAASRQGPAGET